MKGRAQLLGVGVDRLTLAEAVERCCKFIAEDEPRLVVTPNAEILYAARQDEELRRVLLAADLVVPDGAGVVLALRWLGDPVPERVPGVDLVDGLLRTLAHAAAARPSRVFLLGARPEVVARAAERVPQLYPGVEVCGYQHGYFSAVQEPQVVGRVRAARPHLLLAGMGAPKQEKWLYRYRRDLGVPLSIGVGGGIDLLAGATQRAPLWMRRANLEWLYRVVKFGRFRRSVPALVRFGLAVLRRGRG